MRLRKSITLLSLVVFLVLTLAGTYYIRRHVLENALRHAVDIGDVASVARLVESFPCPVKSCDRNGFTPLHRAANAGRCEIARLLLSRGANVNAKDYENGTRMTPLRYAVEREHNTAMVELLITHGADLDPRDSSGETPLIVAMGIGSEDVVELLISKGANVNARDNNGCTPLMNGTFGEPERTETLIAHGADINAKSKGGLTALHYAVIYGRKDRVELLIAKGADFNVRDGEGKTPLMTQVSPHFKKDSAEIVELLRKAGAKQ